MSIGKICDFDIKNGTWSSYADRLEMYFKVNNIKDDLKLPTMIAVMGDDAYELLVNLASPKKPSELTYSEAVKLLTQHLQPLPSVLAERYRFRQRRQRTEENVNEYVAELKRLARNCKFNTDLSENLRDQFVCGLRNDVMRQRLFAEDENLNFVTAVKIATSLEAAERDAAAVDERGSPDAAPPSSELHALKPRRPAAVAARRRGGSAGPAQRARTRPCCRGCGAADHEYGNCRFRDYICSKCKREGHLRRVCPAASAGPSAWKRRDTDDGGRGVHFGTTTETMSSDEENCIDLYKLSLKDYKAVSLSICIDGQVICMEIDTGTPISCISKNTYDKYFRHIAVEPYDLCLKFIDGSSIRPLGCIKPVVKYGSISKNLELFVIDGGTTSLLGRQWLKELNIPLMTVNTSCNLLKQNNVNNVNELLDRYKELFDGSLGRYTGGKATLRVREGAAPVFHRARPLPFALRERVDAELDTMLRAGVIEPVDCSDWASPLVPVNKPDGTLRPANREKMMSRSAFVLAALGLGLSTFSVRQMIISQTRRF